MCDSWHSRGPRSTGDEGAAILMFEPTGTSEALSVGPVTMPKNYRQRE